MNCYICGQGARALQNVKGYDDAVGVDCPGCEEVWVSNQLLRKAAEDGLSFNIKRSRMHLLLMRAAGDPPFLGPSDTGLLE